MNPHLIKQLFRNPSASLLAANAHDYGTTHPTDAPLPDAEPAQQARALEPDHARKAQGAGRPLVRFTLRRVALLDVDAKWGSIKDTLDGLQYAGLIHSDKEGEIYLEVRQEKIAHRKDETTEIEIFAPEES